MAPTNGAAGQPAGVRRPAGGLKPVVPAIPLFYLQRPNKPPPTAKLPQQQQSQQVTSSKPLQTQDQTTATPPEVEAGEERIHNEDKQAQGPAVEQTNADTALDQTAHEQSPTSTTDTAKDVTARATPVNEVLKKTERAASPAPIKATMKEPDTPPVSHQSSSSATIEGNVASSTQTRRPLQDHPNPGPNRGSYRPNHNHHHVSQSSIGSMLGGTPNGGQFSYNLDHMGLYQPHPGNGGVVFGGFHGSNNSSPAPFPGGSHGLGNAHLTNHIDYSHMAATDGDGRHMVASPSADSFAHLHQHQQLQHQFPPTPHSFHGSQSSIQADETMYGRFPLANGHTGPPGYSLGALPPHMHGFDRQQGGRFDVSGTSSSGQIMSRSEVQILDFLRSAFDNAEFADTELHLYLSRPDNPEPQHPDMVIPCHQLMLMQSPRLRDLLLTREASAGNRLDVKVHNPYIQAFSFRDTLRTMYGWDIGDGPLPALQPPRNIEEALILSLEFAASADYLQLPLVCAKAMHRACHQLTWDTVERAYHFVLPGAVCSRAPGLSSMHNLSSSELLDAIVAFLVHSLPVDFVLDSKAGDPNYVRLPLVPGAAAPQVDRDDNAHSRQDSTAQARMPRKSRAANPRLSLIQFGDLSLYGAGPTPSGHSDMSSRGRQPTRIESILSRILLNLPFSMLKQVLEHPALAKPSGELSPQKRHEIIASIVAEREARRAHVLDQLDQLPELQVYADKLEHATEPLDVQHMGDFLVNNMGFKEEVFPGDVPYLVQRWVHPSDSASS